MAKIFPSFKQLAGHARRWAPLLLPLLTLALFTGGCGEPPAAPPAVTDSGETAVTPPSDALLAADLPFAIGSELVYSANTPGTKVRVSFELDGPWNFAAGPTSSTLTITGIAKETAPSQDQFPEATEVRRSSWSPADQPVIYDFQTTDDSSWRSLGQAGADEAAVNQTPALLLIFPVELGSQWSNTYLQTRDGQTVEITTDNLIVSRNRITVPAGTYFDALLLQTRMTTISDTDTTVVWDYTWFVPGVGPVAEIISEPNEPGETFNSATAFYRLRRVE